MDISAKDRLEVLLGISSFGVINLPQRNSGLGDCSNSRRNLYRDSLIGKMWVSKTQVLRSLLSPGARLQGRRRVRILPPLEGGQSGAAPDTLTIHHFRKSDGTDVYR